MVTLQDIATAAGVSRATVSVVLNDRGKSLRISDANISRIRSIAADLGYCRNDLARSVITGKSNAIGFLSSNLISEHLNRVLDGVLRVAQSRNFLTKVLSADVRFYSCSDIIRQCLSQRLAGIVIYDLLDFDYLRKLHEVFCKHKIPLALIADPGSSSRFDKVVRVYSNQDHGGRVAFEHLHNSGRSNFLLLQNFASYTWSKDRINSFITAAADYGVPAEKLKIIKNASDYLFEPEELREIIDNNNFDAIFCTSDFIALNVINHFTRMGISVPADIAVLGYGNYAFCKYASPAISSVEENLGAIAQKATETLLEKITREVIEESDEMLDTQIIARNST